MAQVFKRFEQGLPPRPVLPRGFFQDDPEQPALFYAALLQESLAWLVSRWFAFDVCTLAITAATTRTGPFPDLALLPFGCSSHCLAMWSRS